MNFKFYFHLSSIPLHIQNIYTYKFHFRVETNRNYNKPLEKEIFRTIFFCHTHWDAIHFQRSHLINFKFATIYNFWRLKVYNFIFQENVWQAFWTSSTLLLLFFHFILFYFQHSETVRQWKSNKDSNESNTRNVFTQAFIAML